jgi:hypothetical protein
LTTTDPATYTGTRGGTGTTPVITVVKAVNAVNPAARLPPRTPTTGDLPAYVLPGSSVTYTYAVRATADLRTITIVDDNGTPGNTGRRLLPTRISGGQQQQRRPRSQRDLDLPGGRANAPLGLTTNVARVTGVANGVTYIDDDPASSFGWTVVLDLVKATKRRRPEQPDGRRRRRHGAGPGPAGRDARRLDLPRAQHRQPRRRRSSWATDAGTAATGDDFAPRYVSGDTNANGKVDPGEVWLYTSAGVRAHTVAPGQYVNTAVLSAKAPDGSSITRRERSHHFGVTAPLVLVKSVNAADESAPTPYEDANVAPGVIVAAGGNGRLLVSAAQRGLRPDRRRGDPGRRRRARRDRLHAGARCSTDRASTSATSTATGCCSAARSGATATRSSCRSPRAPSRTPPRPRATSGPPVPTSP